MTRDAGDEPLVERMRDFRMSIFTEMSALAITTGSINLGQGFADTDGPLTLLEAGLDAIRAGYNQGPYVRFAFCKKPEVLSAALERLKVMA